MAISFLIQLQNVSPILGCSRMIRLALGERGCHPLATFHLSEKLNFTMGKPHTRSRSGYLQDRSNLGETLAACVFALIEPVFRPAPCRLPPCIRACVSLADYVTTERPKS